MAEVPTELVATPNVGFDSTAMYVKYYNGAEMMATRTAVPAARPVAARPVAARTVATLSSRVVSPLN